MKTGKIPSPYSLYNMYFPHTKDLFLNVLFNLGKFQCNLWINWFHDAQFNRHWFLWHPFGVLCQSACSQVNRPGHRLEVDRDYSLLCCPMFLPTFVNLFRLWSTGQAVGSSLQILGQGEFTHDTQIFSLLIESNQFH